MGNPETGMPMLDPPLPAEAATDVEPSVPESAPAPVEEAPIVDVTEAQQATVPPPIVADAVTDVEGAPRVDDPSLVTEAPIDAAANAVQKTQSLLGKARELLGW